jgi:hypothetical protein
MDNVIPIKGFQFQNYKVGRKHLLKSLEDARIGEAERASYSLRQMGDFFRLARLRARLTVEDAALLFDLDKNELEAFERGAGKVPAPLISNFCVKYGVEKDFEEFYSYLRGATRPEEMAAFQKVRPILEKYGWMRPKDW